MEKTEDCGGNPCSEQLKSIYEYLDGALSAEEIAQLQEHLIIVRTVRRPRILRSWCVPRLKARVHSRLRRR